MRDRTLHKSDDHLFDCTPSKSDWVLKKKVNNSYGPSLKIQYELTGFLE